MSQPNYYGILIAPVRYDKDLCPGAKVFYSELTALTQKEGYCWAKNKYFMDLYEVEERTIQKWLKQLKLKGYIEIEISNGKNRQIFMSDQKNINPDKNDGVRKLTPSKTSGYPVKKVAVSNKTYITPNTTRNNKTSVASPPPFTTLKNISLSVQEYKKLVDSCGKELAKLAIKELSDWKLDNPSKAAKRKSDYRCLEKWAIDAAREKQLKKQELAQREARLKKYQTPGITQPHFEDDDNRRFNKTEAINGVKSLQKLASLKGCELKENPNSIQIIYKQNQLTLWEKPYTENGIRPQMETFLRKLEDRNTK